MTPSELTEMVAGIAGWATFFWVAQYVLLPTAIDYMREELFDIRRELIMLVAEGHLSATDDAYVRLRRLLNFTLQYAERITFWRLFMMAVLFDPRFHDEPTIDDAVARIHNVRTRAAVRRLHERTGSAIMFHIARTSPTAWVVMLVTSPYLLVRSGVRRILALASGSSRLPSRLYPVARFEAQAETLACA